MASIEDRGNGSYRLIVELGYDGKGKRLRRTKTVKCKGIRDARKELAKFQVEVESGEYIKPENVHFAKFVEDWREKYAEKHLSNKTIETYDYLLPEILDHFGHMKLENIKPIHIISYLDDLENREEKPSSSTIHFHYRILRDILGRASEWKIIKDNPVASVKRPKVTYKDGDVYDEEEVVELFQLLEDEQPHWRLFIKLAVTAGLRRGELLALEWDDVDFENNTISVNHSLSYNKEDGYQLKVPKTKTSIRVVSVPQSVMSELKKYKHIKNKERMQARDLWEGGDHFFVFSNWNGKPYYPTAPSTWWRRFTKRTEFRYIRLHDLRHTSATILINQGVHAKTISSRLGHADIQTTMNIYGHALRKADEGAAEKFDSLFDQNESEKA